MKSSTNSYLYLFIGLLSLSVMGYTVTEQRDSQSITRIDYAFIAAQAPAQFHRSYSISLTTDQARITIDSFEETLADQTISFSKKTFDDLANQLKIYRIDQQNGNKDALNCSGHMAKSLTVYAGEDVVLNGSVHLCGEEVSGNLSGDIDGFSKRLRDAIPVLTNLVNEPPFTL